VKNHQSLWAVQTDFFQRNEDPEFNFVLISEKENWLLKIAQ
jgi:hypothetical protein